MATSYSMSTVVGVVIAIAVLSFLIRVSFIALFGRMDEIPPRVERALRYVPAAVLAALAVPSVLTIGPAGTLALDKLVGGSVGAVVAWRTENVLATMGAGMGALWVVRFAL